MTGATVTNQRESGGLSIHSNPNHMMDAASHREISRQDATEEENCGQRSRIDHESVHAGPWSLLRHL
jgi:hypothetical protein